MKIYFPQTTYKLSCKTSLTKVVAVEDGVLHSRLSFFTNMAPHYLTVTHCCRYQKPAFSQTINNSVGLDMYSSYFLFWIMMCQRLWFYSYIIRRIFSSIPFLEHILLFSTWSASTILNGF